MRLGRLTPRQQHAQGVQTAVRLAQFIRSARRGPCSAGAVECGHNGSYRAGTQRAHAPLDILRRHTGKDRMCGVLQLWGARMAPHGRHQRLAHADIDSRARCAQRDGVALPYCFQQSAHEPDNQGVVGVVPQRGRRRLHKRERVDCVALVQLIRRRHFKKRRHKSHPHIRVRDVRHRQADERVAVVHRCRSLELPHDSGGRHRSDSDASTTSKWAGLSQTSRRCAGNGG